MNDRGQDSELSYENDVRHSPGFAKTNKTGDLRRSPTVSQH